jgi:hypothetical protein
MTQYQAQWADGTVVRWRALSWVEYRRFQHRVSALDATTVCDIYTTCVIQGPPPERVPAGVAQFICEQLLEGNPFGGDAKLLKQAVSQARQQLQNSYFLQARALIMRAFHCSFEDIDKWDASLFFERLAMAEMIVGVNVEPVDPRAAKDHQSKIPAARPMNITQAIAAERVRERDRSVTR